MKKDEKIDITEERIISSKVTGQLIKDLDFYSKKMRMNRSQLIRNLLESGLEEIKIIDKTGFLAMALKGQDILSYIRKAFLDDNYEIKDKKLTIDL